ncbi:MAG: tRNA (guanosine(37)-N1)-methyltransferase TrmD [Chloroflexi bacterium]|nr:tRNA (guanosine(37)-N1)-methyltransferase TrmD [Chloroflexota bacterium]
MRIHVFTLFPAMLEGYLQESILKRAQAAGLLTVSLHNIRDYATDRHHVTDDTPYGGGGGMVMKPEPIFAAVEATLGLNTSTPPHPHTPIILLSPTGRLFNQTIARELAAHDRIALICGRYEGVDDRVRRRLATDEISVGDYVLTGGELPAMILIDAIARHVPGVLGQADAADADSHATGLLEYPHYTRPADFRGWVVPEILQSGDHAQIARWRRQQSLRRTWQQRPDLLLTAPLTEDDKRYLLTLAEEQITPVR